MPSALYRRFSWFFASVAASGLYAIYAFDLFEDEDRSDLYQLQIELDEALLLGGVLIAMLLAYVLRLLHLQRSEYRARMRAEALAETIGYRDALTGIANRRRFDQRLQQMVDLADSGGVHGVFLIDLNGFKQVNDTHGHAAGDELLKVVARRLETIVREFDLAARFGGDEFAVLAPDLADSKSASHIAERIIDALGAPVVANGAIHRIGAGIGVALAPEHGTTPRDVLNQADTALYLAKAQGQSCYRFAGTQRDVAAG